MSAITPVAPVAYLDDGYQYKPSVHTAHYCSNCRRSMSGYNPEKCPIGCHTDHAHPGWRPRGYTSTGDYRIKNGRNSAEAHHIVGRRRSIRAGAVRAAE